MLKQHESADINYTLEKLFRLQRLGIKVGLEHTFELLKRCGNPHNNLRTIHLAGTNGKGSTAAMVQSILRNAGLKVGLYTSPHLVSFNERIRVNGTQVSNNFIIDFMKKFNDDIDEIFNRSILKDQIIKRLIANENTWKELSLLRKKSNINLQKSLTKKL